MGLVTLLFVSLGTIFSPKHHSVMMNNTMRCFSFLSATLLLSVSVIGFAKAEDLDSAVKSALANHPTIESAIANEMATSAERAEEFASYFPDLNVRATGGRIFADNSTSRGLTVTRGSAYSYLWEGGVTLTQPIFRGFETVNKVDAAEDRIESAKYNVMDIRENLSLRTVLSYLDVIRAREILDEMDAYDARLAEYIERIEVMVAEGAADESLLSRAVDIKAELKNTIANIRSSVRSAQAEYVELVGHAPTPDMNMPFPDLQFMSGNVDELVAYTLENHPFLLSSYYKGEAIKEDYAAAKEFYYPDLDGELSYLIRDQKEEIGGELTDARAVVRLNWDFSIGGADFAKTRGLAQRHIESQARWKDSRRQIERQLRVAYSDMIRSQEQLEIQNERKELAEELFTTYKTQFEGARVDILKLVQADNDLFSTELAAINGKFALVGSQYTVLASMGRLQEALSLIELTEK